MEFLRAMGESVALASLLLGWPALAFVYWLALPGPVRLLHWRPRARVRP